MRYSPLSCAADASRHGADLEAWPRTYSGESGQPPYPPLCGRFGFRVVPGPGYEHRAAARRLVHPAVGPGVALRVAAGSPRGLGGGEEPAPRAAPEAPIWTHHRIVKPQSAIDKPGPDVEHITRRL